MKFVTVMDMWLLICNIGLLGCLIYVVRQMINLAREFQTWKYSEVVDKEMKYVVQLIKDERDNLESSMSDADIDIKMEFCDDIIGQIERRRTKNIIAAAQVK
jgi:hypothetical protein